MSTSPEDNEPTERTPDDEREPDAGDAPVDETEAPFAAEGDAGAPAGAGAAVPRREAPGQPRPGGALSAETFALTALVLLALPVFSGQPLQLLTAVLLIGEQPVAVDQVTQITIQTAVSGAPAVLAVLLAGLSLALAGPGTRPWARWAATTALIVGLLLVLVAVLTFILIPAGTELPPPALPN